MLALVRFDKGLTDFAKYELLTANEAVTILF